MSDKNVRQIFQASSPTRWKSFIWSFRVFIISLLVVAGFVITDIFIMPKLIDKNKIYHKVIDPTAALSFSNRENEDLHNLKKDLKRANTPPCCSRYGNKKINLTVKDFPMDTTVSWMKKPGHEKELVLTFDDGPDARYTPAVLDILKKENVKAAFFVLGVNAEDNIPLLRRLAEEGHDIGNHTFTHPNLNHISARRVLVEMRANKRLIECITGRSTILYRPPFSEDGTEKIGQQVLPVIFSRHEHYIRIGDPIDSKDWMEESTSDSIMKHIERTFHLGNFILMHDGGGKREATVEALPRIIKYYRSKGYKFVSMSEFLGVNHDVLNPPLKHDTDRFLSYSNLIIAHIVYYSSSVLFPFFFIGIILSIGRMFFVGTFAYIEFKRSKKIGPSQFSTATPLVSIIVPAYNEEVNVISSLENLLKSDYPNFEIVFVDDGSKDKTYQLVKEAFENHPKVMVNTKPNGGKSSALNYGIDKARGDYFVCIDADTQLQYDAISQLMKYFINDKVGAVAGNVKVGNANNIITKWQSIEYITSQNFDRRAFDYFNCITVIPGAIGVFKREAMLEAGKFDVDTLAEDCDLTIRILRKGYVVKNCTEAIAMTEAPESVKQFMKQRFRWTFGIMQTFWKHKDACFNPKFKGLGLLALPNFLIYSLFIPMLTPLSDILMIIAIATGNGKMIIIYYFAFFIVEVSGAIMAFSFEKEKIGVLWLMLLQRIIYKYILWIVLMKAFLKAIKGELQGWGVLKRTGSVGAAPAAKAAA